MSNWVDVKNGLPDKQFKFVLVQTKSNYANKIVARFVPRFTEAYGDDEFGEYCEERDDWFLPEGWYANVSPMSDEYMSYYLDEEVTHWMLLPESPKENTND